MFWLPFLTVISSFVGGMVESHLAGRRSIESWLLRLIMPAIIGAVWFALVVGYDPSGRGGRPWFDLMCFVGFSIPAWVGMYAVAMARGEDR